MIYQQGTASVTNGSQQVTGSGTKWLKKVSKGHLFTTGDGVHYQVARVASDTELYLASDFGGSTQSGIAYYIYSDFTEYYSLPYPDQSDVWKLSVWRRAMMQLDKKLEALNQRVIDVEYPGVNPLDITLPSSIDAISLSQNQGLSVTDPVVTPSIDVTYIQQSQPGGLLVDDATVTPSTDTVVIQVAGAIYLLPEDATATPEITSVTFADLVTADSTETADSSTILADGSGGPAAPDVFIVLDQLVTPVIDSVSIQQQSGITLVMSDATVSPSIDVVDLSGGIVTADSDSVTADANTTTADGLLAA